MPHPLLTRSKLPLFDRIKTHEIKFHPLFEAHKTLGVGGFPFVQPAVAIRGLYDCTVSI